MGLANQTSSLVKYLGSNKDIQLLLLVHPLC